MIKYGKILIFWTILLKMRILQYEFEYDIASLWKANNKYNYEKIQF